MANAKLEIFAGVFYPQSTRVRDNGVPGYVIAQPKLEYICKKLIGCPITLEHHGIAKISKFLSDSPTGIEVIRALNVSANLTGQSEQRPIGVVSDAYRNSRGEYVCVFCVNATKFPNVCWLVHNNILRGLSLSHFEDNTSPLEVSLCQQPARPECFITAGPFALPSAAFMYKAIDKITATY